MPPKGRTAIRPFASRLHGQPQCSRRSSSSGASLTNTSTASWSHSQSPPEIVSYACSSRLSSGAIAPAAPPSAETVWLRIGYTFDTTAVLELGVGFCYGDRRPKTRAAAADDHHVMRRGHQRPPVRSDESFRAYSADSISSTSNFPVVAHDLPTDAAVVVLVLDALTPARVDGFLGHDDLVIVVFVAFAVDESPTRGLLTFEAAVGVHVASPLFRVTWGTPTRRNDDGAAGRKRPVQR